MGHTERSTLSRPAAEKSIEGATNILKIDARFRWRDRGVQPRRASSELSHADIESCFPILTENAFSRKELDMAIEKTDSVFILCKSIQTRKKLLSYLQNNGYKSHSAWKELITYPITVVNVAGKSVGGNHRDYYDNSVSYEEGIRIIMGLANPITFEDSLIWD